MPARIEFVPEIGSTSAELLSRLARGEAVPEGYWLVADRQTAGRGRQGRHWLDAAGNFMGSTVVRLGANGPPPPATLSFVAALAAYEAVSEAIAAPEALSLKWPNDLLLDGAKVAGILLERAGDAAVVGIGVNLASAPSLPDRSTGHVAALGPAPDRDVFARNLAAAFDRELARWREVGLGPLLRRFVALSAHAVGAPLTVHDGTGAAIEGTFAGLDEANGALTLRLEDGTERVIHAGDVILGGT